MSNCDWCIVENSVYVHGMYRAILVAFMLFDVMTCCIQFELF